MQVSPILLVVIVLLLTREMWTRCRFRLSENLKLISPFIFGSFPTSLRFLKLCKCVNSRIFYYASYFRAVSNLIDTSLNLSSFFIASLFRALFSFARLFLQILQGLSYTQLTFLFFLFPHYPDFPLGAAAQRGPGPPHSWCF